MKRIKNFNNFKLYEFEENSKIPQAEVASFMDNLYQRIKEELVPIIPTEFKVDYDRGKEISIHTDNDKDLRVGAKISNEKMVVYSFPINEPSFDINYNFDTDGANNIINSLKKEFQRSETNGLVKSSKKSIKRDLKDFDIEDMDIDTPITDKPNKNKKRSINIKVIKNVLEDAFIMDEIELNTVTTDELIRRMLVESRKK